MDTVDIRIEKHFYIYIVDTADTPGIDTGADDRSLSAEQGLAIADCQRTQKWPAYHLVHPDMDQMID